MKTRVAVIGSGFGLYGLLPAFQRVADCSVAGISGIITDRLANYCQKNFVDVYPDWRDMIDRAKPDAIAVAVIPKYQPEIVLYALERGISVFAEKPLAVNLDQARQLLERARERKVAHMIDFIFPEIPEWKKARELLDEGGIGKPIHLSMTWNFISYDLRNNVNSWKTNDQDGGGALAFYFSHVFYNIEYFLGPIRNLYCNLNYSAKSANSGESIVNLLLKFQSGCTASILLSCSSMGPNRHEWEFQGEAGTLIVTNPTKGFARGFELWHYVEPACGKQIALEQSPVDPALDERVCLVASLGKRFVAWCQLNKVSKPDFEDGFRVQQLIDLARVSFKENRVMDLNLLAPKALPIP